jgi:4-carboxymuconolactone decarboxylase
MTTASLPQATLGILDEPTRRLVRLSAFVAVSHEERVRSALVEALESSPKVWIEELILQSYLFCGLPRTLNAMREWRRLTGDETTRTAEDGDPSQWRRRGEATCRLVYGRMYDQLRVNIRGLHPELDEWMIVEGYGKVLSRAGLDLARRELCIVAACAATRQERQLHSHFHGALNVGVSPGVVTDTLAALSGAIDETAMSSAQLLWRRVERHAESS